MLPIVNETFKVRLDHSGYGRIIAQNNRIQSNEFSVKSTRVCMEIVASVHPIFVHCSNGLIVPLGSSSKNDIDPGSTNLS